MRKIRLELERPIAFYPPLAKALGGTDEAVYLQQLYYWSDKGSRADGFIYKTKAEIEAETSLSIRVQDRVRKQLVELGVMETKLLKANGAPTLHYRVDTEALQEILDSYQTSDSNHTVGGKPLTETTTETTTATTNVVGVPPDEDGDRLQKLQEQYEPEVLEGEIVSPEATLPAVDILTAKQPKEYGDPGVNRIVSTFELTFELKLRRVKQQRLAASNLIKRYGETNVLGAIRYAGQVRDEQYSPQILSLEDLWEKWDKLVAHKRKTDAGKQSKVTVIEED